ncbi:MAG: hypothetical protein JO307_15765, partial [Bryobacterales bacterium]|nr:hypothetical protein [Bryobacterales bacterium]
MRLSSNAPPNASGAARLPRIHHAALIGAFLTASLLAVPMWAHHGSTGFDRNKRVHLVGKVSLLEWSNPHVVIHLDVGG